MELLAVENLSFTYPECDHAALCGITFSLRRGEFAAVCGATGSGKSTLLRMLKRELTPLGAKSGRVLYRATPLESLPDAVSACRIGFVMQRPEQQLVTDKVWHELAFGLENMGVPSETIRRRVAEMACYFGIADWFERDVASLSGGQKQLLNLAAVMVMQPEVLILDEPTAQLDPIAAAEFLATLQKLNRELSLTILLAEHRLEDVVPVCDRLLVMRAGALLANDAPRTAIRALRDVPELLCAMPAAVRLYHALGAAGDCPLTVREGREFVVGGYGNAVKAPEQTAYTPSQTPALSLSDVYFRYGRALPDVLCGLTFTVYEGESYCILGENGAGKSTALAAAAKCCRIYSGQIRVFGKKLQAYDDASLYHGGLALLPQDVQTVFLRNTVREELADADQTMLGYDFTPLLSKHPYDLSGGEQQLVALAKVLAGKPRLLLLDEPTKGLDAHAKQGLLRVLQELKAGGMTIVTVTHDVEFAAEFADRCALFFRGEIVSEDVPRRFFAENYFYTTAASRMTRGYFENVVTLADAVELCRKNGRREESECL